jgi:hypothetical protein
MAKEKEDERTAFTTPKIDEDGAEDDADDDDEFHSFGNFSLCDRRFMTPNVQARVGNPLSARASHEAQMAEDSEAPPIANGETSPKQQHGRFFPYR